MSEPRSPAKPKPAPAARVPRWTRRREARPAEIVEAALAVFAERGYAAARLDEVATRAGVSKGTLYLYFDNKEALLKAVVRQAVVPNLAEAERLFDSFDGPTAVILTRLIERVGTIVAESQIGAIPKLIIAEAGNFPEIAHFYLTEVVHRAFRLLGRVLERGMASGEFRRLDTANTVRLVIAPVIFSAIWRHSLGRYDAGAMDVRAFLAAHVDMLLRGLAPEQAPKGSPQ